VFCTHAAVWRRKELQRFESDQKSFFKKTLFFIRFTYEKIVNPVFRKYRPHLKMLDRSNCNTAVLRHKLLQGKQHSLHVGITCVGSILLVDIIDHSLILICQYLFTFK